MSDDAPVRLFVAAVPPDHVRTLVTAARAPAHDQAPELTWTRPEGWHVTLAFLGDVAATDLDAVAGVVTDVAGRTEAFEARVADAGRPDDRVLWLAVDDDPRGAFAALGERLQAGLAAVGLPVRRRSVRAHLTLARAARGRRIDDALLAAVAGVEAGWEVDHVVALRSVRGDGPARYVPVVAAPLAGPPAGDDASAAPASEDDAPS